MMVSPHLVIYGVRCTLGRFSLEHFYRANSRLHSRVHPLRGMSGRGKKMSLWGVIYFFSKRNVSHVAIPTYFFPVSKRVAKKFMPEKIREINGSALRKEEECVNKRRNISVPYHEAMYRALILLSGSLIERGRDHRTAKTEPELFSVWKNLFHVYVSFCFSLSCETIGE